MYAFHSEARIIKVNNKDLLVQVNCFYDYESDPPDVDFGSDKENKDYLKKFETGELSNLWVSVRASISDLDVYGESSLGGIHVNSNSIDKELMEIIIEELLIEETITNLISNLKIRYQKFKELFE